MLQNATNGSYSIDRYGNVEAFVGNKSVAFFQGDADQAMFASHLGGPREPNESSGDWKKDTQERIDWCETAKEWLRNHEGESFDFSDYV